MKVIKSSQEVENFSSKKVYRSVIDAGGSRKLARASVKEIRKRSVETIHSKEILKILLKFLMCEKGVSERYGLKQAIMSLGPSGFPFEDYFARILQYYGYKTKVGEKLKGKRIMQEVDIVALKKKKWMIECKYHNEAGILTKLKPAMYTYARFLDLASHKFDSSWLVTNTKCSHDAINYSKGVSQKITSWKYPRGDSLCDLIEKKGLYPITILIYLPEKIKLRLFYLGIVVLKDLIDTDFDKLLKDIGCSRRELERIIGETKDICS